MNSSSGALAVALLGSGRPGRAVQLLDSARAGVYALPGIASQERREPGGTPFAERRQTAPDEIPLALAAV